LQAGGRRFDPGTLHLFPAFPTGRYGVCRRDPFHSPEVFRVSLTVPAVGAPAPDFSLNTTSGETVTLPQYQGKSNVLLAFFPLAFTSTCTAEMCAFTEDYSAFAQYDVVVIPVSVDAVPSLKAFRDHYKMGLELASDFKREASRAYGTLMEHTFFSNRAYFLIDKQGILRWAFVEDNPGGVRQNAEILAEIAKL
jgi:glutaredoxin-dependent peroxiredoxin